jgi:putative transposase
VRPQFTLRLLSGAPLEQKRRYAEILARNKAKEAPDALEEPDAVARLLRAMVSAFPNLFGKLAGKGETIPDEETAVLNDVQLEQRITAITLGSRPLRPETRKARCFLMQQMVSRGFNRKQIADRFGVSAKTVYNILKHPS